MFNQNDNFPIDKHGDIKIRLADTVSMEHANEIFSNGKYRIENESIAWTVGEFATQTNEMFT